MNYVVFDRCPGALVVRLCCCHCCHGDSYPRGGGADSGPRGVWYLHVQTSREIRTLCYLQKLWYVLCLFNMNETTKNYAVARVLLVPYRLAGGTLSLLAVRLSVSPSVSLSHFSFPDFSLLSFEIMTSNLVYELVVT